MTKVTEYELQCRCGQMRLWTRYEYPWPARTPQDVPPGPGRCTCGAQLWTVTAIKHVYPNATPRYP